MDVPFLLDSNFFIEAYRNSYPFDVFPSFWNKVKELAEAGRIISIDKVLHELHQNKDELSKWCDENLPADFFKDSTVVIPNYTLLINWVYSKSDQYSQPAISEFLDAAEADAWLVAYAMTNGNHIVTHEISSPYSKNKVKLPDAAVAFNVTCVKTPIMFRLLGEQM